MKVTVARTPAEVDALAERWDGIPVESPHASRALFVLVDRAAGENSRPHVILVERDGEPPILVVGRVERRPFEVRAGYRVLLRTRARWLSIVPGGVIGARTPEDHRQVVGLLRRSLARGEADILQLSKVEVGGPLHEATTRRLAWYERGRGLTPLRNHRSALAGGFDAFLAARSKGTRWRIRRRLKKLTEQTSELTLWRVGSGDSPDAVAAALDTVAARSYQRGIGVGFVDDDLHRGLVSWAVEGGPFQVWILKRGGVPLAYVNGVLHERTFHLFETAFDASAADDEPGAILIARVLEELASDPDVDGFDYGFGDAQYKQSLSDSSVDVADLLGFAARPRPLMLNSLNLSSAAAISMAKRLLGKERIAALRRRKRAELASTTGSDDGELATASSGGSASGGGIG
jgi:CelD/BcsL family acetyltransferase involved in cellulose biosynthesis